MHEREGSARAVRATPRSLEVTWREGTPRSTFAWLWLRDHCPCAECRHPQTGQRQLDTSAIPPDIAAQSVRLDAGGAVVEVEWSADAHRSSYPVADLAALAAAREDGAEARPERVLWDAAMAGADPPAVEYAAVMDGDGALRAWLEAVERFGFCFVRGVPHTPEDTRRLAQRVAYIRESIFGGFWDFIANMAHGDTAYTNLELRPHTDGTYCLDAPGLQMFHCLHFDGGGGESVMVDGFRVADDLRREDPGAFEVLSTVAVPGRYVEPGVHLRASHPVLSLDAHGDPEQVSFNNYDRAPFRLPEPQMDAFYRALRAFDGRLRDPAMQFVFTLTPGEAFLFDNWRVLHGRRAYTGSRRLVGCYLNREDFLSRLRVLRGAG